MPEEPTAIVCGRRAGKLTRATALVAGRGDDHHAVAVVRLADRAGQRLRLTVGAEADVGDAGAQPGGVEDALRRIHRRAAAVAVEDLHRQDRHARRARR